MPCDPDAKVCVLLANELSVNAFVNTNASTYARNWTWGKIKNSEDIEIMGWRYADEQQEQLAKDEQDELAALRTEKAAMHEVIKKAYSNLASIESCLGSLARIGRMPIGGEDSGNWMDCVQSHKYAQKTLTELKHFLK